MKKLWLGFGLFFYSCLLNASEMACAEEAIPEIQAQYIFIGENHLDLNSRDFLSANLLYFKSLGFNDLFVEFIETKDQHIVDQFNKDPKANYQNILRTYGLPGDWGYDTDSYTYLVLRVAVSNIRLHGLDRRTDLHYIVDKDLKMGIRDEHMFTVAKQFIERNPEKKIIFFNGYDHSFKNEKLKSPSFYQRFIEHFHDKKIVNIQKDFRRDYSKLRIQLFDKYKSLDLNCESGFVFYKHPKNSSFDYSILESNENLFPIEDSSVSL